MTNFIQAFEAADALTDQLQGLTENSRYLPRFFDTLFGLRTALGNAGDQFASSHGAEAVDEPTFATILDCCEQATKIGAALTPVDGEVSRYAAAVQRAIAALADEEVASSRPTLRGALRLQRPSARRPKCLGVPESTSGTGRSVRSGRRPEPASEPYYASLVKLFPVEAVTLYPLAIGIAGDVIVIRLILIAIITLFVVALRWFGTQEECGGDADVLAIGVSVISFELYAASLGGFGYLPGGPAQTSQLLACITIMWVALVPFALRRARR